MAVICPHCQGIVFEDAPTRYESILKAVREHGPVRSGEIARLVYGRDDLHVRNSIKAQIAIMNRYKRVIASDGRGKSAIGYRYLGEPS